MNASYISIFIKLRYCQFITEIVLYLTLRIIIYELKTSKFDGFFLLGIYHRVHLLARLLRIALVEYNVTFSFAFRKKIVIFQFLFRISWSRKRRLGSKDLIIIIIFE